MYLAICAIVSSVATAVLHSERGVLSALALRTWLALFATQYVAIKLYNFFIYPFYVSPLRRLPGPKNNSFFIGQLANQFKAPSPTSEYVSWAKRWPEAPLIRFLSVGNTEVLLVNSVSALREVSQVKFYSFIKPAFFQRLLRDLTGKGLLFSVGEDHRKQRRQFVGPFSRANIRKLHPVFRKKSRGLIAYLESTIQSDQSSEGGVFEVESAVTKTTLDVIGVAAMGIELNNLSVTGSPMDFFDCYHKTLGQSGIPALITFLDAFFPLRWLPIEANRIYSEAATGLKTMLKSVIQQRVRDISVRKQKNGKDQETSKDILTFMIETMELGEATWTNKELREHLLQFVSAGHETIAGVLTWAIYVLARSPDIQERLREEVLGVLVDNAEPSAPTVENLKYLNNFIHECLRVYSPAIMLPREAGQDVLIGNVMIPKGTAIVISPAAIHSNPTIWGEDADEFRPERWDELTGDAASTFAFEAFTNGPRICPGKGFAMLQIKTVLMDLLSTFALEQMDTITEYQNPALTLRPKRGLRVRVRKLAGL